MPEYPDPAGEDRAQLVLCPVCESQTYLGVEFAALECTEPKCIWFDPGHEARVKLNLPEEPIDGGYLG